MFSYQTIGKITGINSSRDGKIAYIDLLCDAQDRTVDLQGDETPDNLNLQCDASLLPPGTGFGTRVQVEGSGVWAAKAWTDPNKVNAKPKIIHNLRLQVRSIKLAK